MAVKWMSTNKIDFGMLHTGNAAPLYAKLGWKAIRRSLVSFTMKSLFSEKELNENLNTELNSKLFRVSSNTAENIDEVDDGILAQVRDLHEKFCMNSNIAGFVSRNHSTHMSSSVSYWKDWIFKVMEKPRPKDDVQRFLTIVMDSSAKKVESYAIHGVKADGSQVVKEYMFNLGYQGDAALLFLTTMLQAGANSNTVIELPLPVWKLVTSTRSAEKFDLHFDEGTMYFEFGRDVDFKVEIIDVDLHAFWNLDSF